MNRKTLIAVAVCLIMIAAIGASAVAAQQDSNPRQAGVSSVYFSTSRRPTRTDRASS